LLGVHERGDDRDVPEFGAKSIVGADGARRRSGAQAEAVVVPREVRRLSIRLRQV
jgi:hypothetical protein